MGLLQGASSKTFDGIDVELTELERIFCVRRGEELTWVIARESGDCRRRDCRERYMAGRRMASRRVASMAGLSSISMMAEELGDVQ